LLPRDEWNIWDPGTVLVNYRNAARIIPAIYLAMEENVPTSYLNDLRNLLQEFSSSD
jgi:hypothetical protein